MQRTITRRSTRFLTDYERQTDETPAELVVPEDLTSLSAEDLAALSTQAHSAFDDLYASGQEQVDGRPRGYTAEELDSLGSLTDAIEAIDAETGARETAAAERSDAAAALASRVRGQLASEGDADGDDEDGDEGDEEDGDDADGDGDVDQDAVDNAGDAASEGQQPAAEAPVTNSVTASSRGTTRVNLSNLRSRQGARPATSGRSTARAVASADVPGFSQGSDMNLAQMGVAIDNRLAGFSVGSFDRAAAEGQHLRQQYGIATIRKSFPEGTLVASANDDADAALEIATRESNMRRGGDSLVASGGWCAPSETLYELFDEGVSREGIFSLPEIGVTRGGIKWTRGPNYADVFTNTGFAYTEAQDISGTNYPKPCYKVACTSFDEARLALDGLCITAGLLMRRGYPELISKTVQLALIAHDHRLSGKKIAAIEAGSTAVTMPANQVGATAPLLSAIELQTQHYRHSKRLSQNATLEAVFPFWVTGVIRSDLSRRLGVDLLSVTDAQIIQWFTQRGISPQFVYNWQDIGTTAVASFVAWPTTVKFLLYVAGTWAGASSDVITLDTIYDSVQLGTNDYTALFTEEGWLVAKRGWDSRVVTVNMAANGETGAGVLIKNDGSVQA